MTQVNKALVLATKAHGDQRRKYTGESYIVHPIEVMGILMAHGITDDNVLAAALLHDVLEDTDVKRSRMLLNGIDQHTIDLVVEVTDVSRPEDGNRLTRKELDRQHLALASPDGQNIKLADLISNTESIVEYDPSFAKIYLKEKLDLLAVLTKADAKMHLDALTKTLQSLCDIKDLAK